MGTRTIRIALATATLLALSPFGCSGERAPDNKGSVEVRAYALTASDVTTVTVTVTGPGIAEPIVVNLTKAGDQWVANLSEIPAGSDRTFTLSARDANGVEIYTGVATGITIVAGQTAAVSISGQETNPAAPVGNRSPVIDALTAETTQVAQSGSIALSVAAHDSDSGDIITYQWTAAAGTLDTPAQASTTWTAPEADGVYRVTIEVQDTHGAKASMYVDLTVGEGSSSEATISVSLNKWPVVSGVSSTQGRIDVSESATLDVVATDADNDTLVYAWTVDGGCAGAFDDAAAKSPVFTLGEALPESGTCEFTVTVSDGRGGTNTGTLTISAAPAPAVNLAPRITSASQSLERVGAGQTVTMSVNAEDPEASAVTFTWTANVGTLGTPTTTAGSSQVVWTAPNPFTLEANVKCTVADASEVTTVKQFHILIASGTTSTSTATSTSTSVDVTPPMVSAFSLTPTSVDTTAGPATAAVSFTVADELSGIASVSVQLTSPSGSQNRSCSVASDAPAPLSLESACNLQFVQNSEAGSWTVKSLVITDAAGNAATLAAADLTGYSATLTVIASTVDTQAPSLAAFSFTPTSVNVTSATANVTVTATVTDNLSGFATAGFMFGDPTNYQWQSCWIYRPSGSSGLRTYSSSCTVEIPQYSLAGAWKVVQVYLADEASNVIRLATADVAAQGLPVDLSVQSDVDATPPVLQAFSLTPSTLDTSAGNVTVTASFAITDDKSGFWQAGVKLTSPSGQQSQVCRIYQPAGQSPLSYSNSCTFVIPRYSETGEWMVEWLYVADNVSNETDLVAADLAAGGLSSSITVTSGS